MPNLLNYTDKLRELSELLELSSWRQSRGYAHPGAEIWSSLQDISPKSALLGALSNSGGVVPAAGQDWARTDRSASKKVGLEL